MDTQNYISLGRPARGGGFPPRGRGYRRGGPGRRPLATGPPPPPPQTPEERIRTLLIRACDKYVIGPGSAGDTNTNNSNDNNGVDPQLEVTEGDTLASSLRAIAGFIKRDTKTHTAQIPETLLECVKALPAKIPLYAALVGLLNDPEITGTLAGKLSEAISRLSDGSVSTSSDVRGFKLVLRFAVALCECNVLTVRSLCAVLDALAGLIGASSHDGARTDTCAYQLAMALAYAGAPLSKDSAGEGPEALKRCVDVLGKYVAARPAGPDDATAKICLSPWKEFSQPRQRDDGLTTVYNALRDGCWTLHCGFSVTADLADSLKEVVPVDLPAVSLQLPQEAADVPFEQAPFFLYDEESMHELSALDAVVLRDLYVDVMTLFQDIPKEAVGCLVHIPTPESAPCALYEAVLSQLLMLPTPPARIVYYQLLLVYLCKVDKKYVAQVTTSSSSKMCQ